MPRASRACIASGATALLAGACWYSLRCISSTGPTGYAKSVNGLGAVGSAITGGLTGAPKPAQSFAEFHGLVRDARPGWCGPPHAANPFPGVLPETHAYARTLWLPRGAHASNVPLLWDTAPGPGGRSFPVLFYDGRLETGLTRQEIDALLSASAGVVGYWPP